MKFSELQYVRPDLEAAKKSCDALIERFNAAVDFKAADAAFLEWDELQQEVYTYSAIGMVRHDLNGKDEFYKTEKDFWDENMPVFIEISQKFDKVLQNSRFRADFEQKYGKLMFVNLELEQKTFKPEIMLLLQEENRLISEYNRYLTEREIKFEGNTYNSSQFGIFKQDADDARRHAAWQADGKSFAEYNARLDENFDKLTKLRDEIARKLGFDSFTGLGYCRMTRNSYSEADIVKFREGVVKYIVPAAERLQRQRAERMCKPYPFGYADSLPGFMDGDPKPVGSADDILAHGRRMYHELSPETAEFIDHMLECEMLDVLSKKDKSGGGYCTGFPKFKTPFIYANFNGTQGDVEVITHEAGHAFAAYTAKDIEPFRNQYPTAESCEIHSMAMEFFAWPWAEGFFGKDTQKFYYKHLSEAICFIPYGTMVDHFQHSVYAKPNMTPEERNAEWRRLMAIYQPWIKLDDLPFFGEGRFWQRQSHIYFSPFYYIDYCLAQTVALQFFVLIQRDKGVAWKRYLDLVRLGGKETFSGLVTAAGLKTPFSGGAIEEIGKTVSDWLDAFDLSKI